uniref:Uncharacterized protein n=1 Tax=Chenopodium quinoa TaxID=63459 RepID=A0A803N9E9_CHEQI
MAHTVSSKRLAALPYANLLPKIFEHFHIPVDTEEFDKLKTPPVGLDLFNKIGIFRVGEDTWKFLSDLSEEEQAAIPAALSKPKPDSSFSASKLQALEFGMEELRQTLYSLFQGVAEKLEEINGKMGSPDIDAVFMYLIPLIFTVFATLMKECGLVENEEDVWGESWVDECGGFTLVVVAISVMVAVEMVVGKGSEGLVGVLVWLNNSVGRKNYFTFVKLMAMSYLWHYVVLEVKSEAVSLLFWCLYGPWHTSLFSGYHTLGRTVLLPYILIIKGIMTYEYVVALRTQMTAISGRSSVGMGLQYKGTWFTPPRIFMDQQAFLRLHYDWILTKLCPEVTLYNYALKLDILLTLLKAKSPLYAIQPVDNGKRVPQRPVKISAWKLAKLDSKEAIKAGAKARASSSVLRLVSSQPHHFMTVTSYPAAM